MAINININLKINDHEKKKVQTWLQKTFILKEKRQKAEALLHKPRRNKIIIP